MDDESKQMLREILDLQREQTKLLQTYLLPPWLRFRFSLRALLIGLTLVALILGITAILGNLAKDTRRTSVVPPVRVGIK